MARLPRGAPGDAAPLSITRPLALLAFNLGVEAGQLMFIGGVLAGGLLVRLSGYGLRSRSLRATAYGIGTLAAFWMFERIAQFWP